MTEDSLRLIPDLDGIVCEVLREHLDVTQCPKGHCWVTPWENHCRKVIELYPLKGTSYPVFWGLNGLLYSFPAADVLTFAITLLVIRRTCRQLSAN